MKSSTDIINEFNQESNTRNINIESLGNRPHFYREMSVKSVDSITEEIQCNEFQEDPVEVEESRSSGSVSSRVYLSYFSAGGTQFRFFVILFISILTQILASVGEYWIAYW